MEVAGEAGRDDPPVAVLGEQRAQDAPDAAFARRVTGDFGVGGVRQQDPDAGGTGELADAGEVRAPIVHGRQVELEVAGVEDHALAAVHGDRVRVRNAVGDGDELDVERPDPPPLVVGHHVQRRPTEQSALLDAVAGEPEGDRGAEDREADLAQQERDAADVVLVPVRRDQRFDALGVLAQVGEVGKDEIDAVQVGAGEHQPAVDEQDPSAVADALLDRHAVAPDLAEPAEKDEADRFSHVAAQPRALRRLA